MSDAPEILLQSNDDDIDAVPILALRRSETYVKPVTIDDNSGVITIHTSFYTDWTTSYPQDGFSPAPAAIETRNFTMPADIFAVSEPLIPSLGMNFISN